MRNFVGVLNAMEKQDIRKLKITNYVLEKDMTRNNNSILEGDNHGNDNQFIL